MRLNQKKIFSYGPGGYRCPCCGPSPKHRKQERKRLRKLLTRLIEKELRKDK